ncbi:hypothetical protein ABIB90_007207 [Bradyrhizobium sp. JR4.1]
MSARTAVPPSGLSSQVQSLLALHDLVCTPAHGLEDGYGYSRPLRTDIIELLHRLTLVHETRVLRETR